MENSLPYAVPYELIPFDTPYGISSGSYNDLVYEVFHEVISNLLLFRLLIFYFPSFKFLKSVSLTRSLMLRWVM